MSEVAEPQVVTFGEAMAVLRGPGPLRLGGNLELSIAGAEATVAIGLARLGHRARWIGRIGVDEVGELVRRTMRAEDVDATVVTDPTRPTGLMLAEQRIGEVTRVSYYRAGSAGSMLAPDDVVPRIRAGVSVVHLTGVTAALGDHACSAVVASATHARSVGATVSLDVNYRSKLWSADAARTALQPLLGSINVLFGSPDELAVIAGIDDPADAIRHLVSSDIEQVVVKRGAAGAATYTAQGITEVAAVEVPAVNLIGAGDSFVAGYLSGMLDGVDITGCLRRAAATAAFCITRHGDWEGLPTRDELRLLELADGVMR